MLPRLSKLKSLIPFFKDRANTARQFHTTSAAKDVSVIYGRIPDDWKAKMQEAFYLKIKSGKARELMTPIQELNRASREFLEFLQKNPSPDAESMLRVIEQFKRQNQIPKKDVVILENLMPPINSKEYPSIANPKDISSDSLGISQEALFDEMKKQELNIQMTQILYNLFGYKIFNLDSDPHTLILVRNTFDQEFHMDERYEKGQFILAVNTLFATKSPLTNAPTTNFVNVDDVIKKLSPETIEILKKPIFAQEITRDIYHLPEPHPILKSFSGRTRFLYPALVGVVAQENAFVEEKGEKVNYFEKATIALQELRLAIKETEQSNALSVTLTALKEDQPDNMIIFNNTLVPPLEPNKTWGKDIGSNILHRRRSAVGEKDFVYPPIVLEGSENRKAISMGGQIDFEASFKEPNGDAVLDVRASAFQAKKPMEK